MVGGFWILVESFSLGLKHFWFFRVILEPLLPLFVIVHDCGEFVFNVWPFIRGHLCWLLLFPRRHPLFTKMYKLEVLALNVLFLDAFRRQVELEFIVFL